MYVPRSFLIIAVLFLGAGLAPLTAGSIQETEIFAQSDLVITRQFGFDVVEIAEGDALVVTGSPRVPCRAVNVAMPAGFQNAFVRVIDASIVELEGRYDLMPCARPRRISNPAQGNPFIKDESVYGSNVRYPGPIVEIMGRWDLAGQEFVTLRFLPIQYNPVTGKLHLANSVTYAIDYSIDPGHVQRTCNLSPISRTKTVAKLERMAVNPEAVAVPLWSGNASRALPAGNFEHVVITTTAYEHEFDTLVDHYTLTGLPSTVVTTDWIYANYSGSSNPEKIRAFVIDANETWGTIYVLIGGDSSKVPYHTIYLKGDNIPNDTFYSDYDADSKCEVYVGRAAVDSTTEISTFLTKTMAYMLSPPSGFGDEAFMMGFDLDSVTPTEDLMKYIISHWMPAWVDLDREYDSESGDHESDVKGYINSGQNLINHSDHCNWNIVGVGSTRHGDHLSISECQAFSNGDRRGIMCSLGCWPGAYDYSDCWGEEFFKDSNGGGVGFVGNSRYGWYWPGSSGGYSCLYNRKYYKVLWEPTYNYYHAGEALGESKNDTPPQDTTKWYIFYELTLFGDPAVPLWTDVPTALNCTYTTTIDPGLQSYTVDVESGGNAVEDALVCLSKDGQVYERGVTDSAGKATLVINPIDGGTMDVTVCAQNHLIDFGSCSVSNGTLPDLAVAMALDKSTYSLGDDMFYDVVVCNSTASSQSTVVWTNVTLPNGKRYPSSGYLDGPTPLTINPNDMTTLSYSIFLPAKAPLGTYVFNAFVGPDPGVEDEDHQTFVVSN